MANRNVETSNGEIFAPGAAPGTPTEGQVYYDSTEHLLKFRTDVGWVAAGGGSGGTTMGSFGSTPNANGGTITAGVLYLQPAAGTYPSGPWYPGGVSAGNQIMPYGTKTFQALVSESVSSPVLLNTAGLGDGGRVSIYTNLGSGASDICVRAGSSGTDAECDAAAKLFSVRTNITGTTEVEYLSVTKTACNVISSAWVADADYVHNSTEIRTDGMIARYGRDSSSDPAIQSEYAPVGINAIASGGTTTTITTSFATTSSHILITWLGDHGAARSWVTRAAGSFTVNLSSAASGNTGFSWMVTSLLAPWISS